MRKMIIVRFRWFVLGDNSARRSPGTLCAEMKVSSQETPYERLQLDGRPISLGTSAQYAIQIPVSETTRDGENAVVFMARLCIDRVIEDWARMVVPGVSLPGQIIDRVRAVTRRRVAGRIETPFRTRRGGGMRRWTS